jgi:hypothetical protein
MGGLTQPPPHDPDLDAGESLRNYHHYAGANVLDQSKPVDVSVLEDQIANGYQGEDSL